MELKITKKRRPHQSFPPFNLSSVYLLSPFPPYSFPQSFFTSPPLPIPSTLILNFHSTWHVTLVSLPQLPLLSPWPKLCASCPFSSFEHLLIFLQVVKENIVILYHPPGHPFSKFFEELGELLNNIFSSTIIKVDFNIPRFIFSLFSNLLSLHSFFKTLKYAHSHAPLISLSFLLPPPLPPPLQLTFVI